MADNLSLNPRRRRRRGVTAAGLIAALLSAVVYRCSDHGAPARPRHDRDVAPAASIAPDANKRFDFYLLTLSLAPAFCEDGHQSRRECQSLDASSFAATPLTLHGLWPENLRPETYPRDCAAGPLQLAPATRSALRRWMPGEADGLATHEWRKHGACTGLSADAYFNAAIDWTAQINAALGGTIRTAAGGSSDAATLRAAANAAKPGLGDSLVFVCKNLRSAEPGMRRRPFLVELRVCLANDGPSGAPGAALQCAQVQRRDQGCGGNFQVDAP